MLDKKQSEVIKICLLVVFILLVIGFGPIITIWALNCLFPSLAIPTNLSTWFAVFWLGSIPKLVGKGK